jgi:formamidopyrimidine-DNA glycosylase
MPELPDVTVYVELIAAKTIGRKIERVRIASPFVVRSVDPPVRDVEGKMVRAKFVELENGLRLASMTISGS